MGRPRVRTGWVRFDVTATRRARYMDRYSFDEALRRVLDAHGYRLVDDSVELFSVCEKCGAPGTMERSHVRPDGVRCIHAFCPEHGRQEAPLTDAP